MTIFLCFFIRFEKTFAQEEDSSQFVQEVDTLPNSLINKKDANIKIVDERMNPLVMGDKPISISWIQEINPRKKMKDKYGVAFPLFCELVKESLQKDGFSTSENSSDYYLEVCLDDLYTKYHDKFSHIQVEQRCSITVNLFKSGGNSLLYQKQFFGVYSCSRADLKMLGYNLDSSFQFLSVSIKEAIKQLLQEEGFQSFFY